MRIASLSLFLLLIATSCKDNAVGKTEGLTVDEVRYKGDYIHLGDAAVISTEDEIYAIQIDDKIQELDERAKEFMRTPYDMVQIIVTGELKPNPRKQETGDGWDQMLVIDKIIEVRKATTSAVMQPPVSKQEDN